MFDRAPSITRCGSSAHFCLTTVFIWNTVPRQERLRFILLQYSYLRFSVKEQLLRAVLCCSAVDFLSDFIYTCKNKYLYTCCCLALLVFSAEIILIIYILFFYIAPFFYSNISCCPTVIYTHKIYDIIFIPVYYWFTNYVWSKYVMNKQWSSKLQLWNFEVWIPKLTGAKGEFD